MAITESQKKLYANTMKKHMTGLDEKLTKVRKPIYNSMLKKGESLNSFVNRTIDET